MTTLKQTVRAAEYYNLLTELPTRFKVKHIDEMKRKDFHILRHADLIEEIPDAMGKEKVWTVSETAETLCEQMDAESAENIPRLSQKQIRFIEKHEEVFTQSLQSVDAEDGFLASDVDIDGRTPEGMVRYNLFQKEEQRNGYPTVWKLTTLGEQVCQMEVAE